MIATLGSLLENTVGCQKGIILTTSQMSLAVRVPTMAPNARNPSCRLILCWRQLGVWFRSEGLGYIGFPKVGGPKHRP